MGDDYEELAEERQDRERKKRRRIVFNIIAFFVLELVFAGAVCALLYWHDDWIPPQISPSMVVLISVVVNVLLILVFFVKGRRGPGWGHRGGGWRRHGGGGGGGWGHQHQHRGHHNHRHHHHGRHR